MSEDINPTKHNSPVFTFAGPSWEANVPTEHQHLEKKLPTAPQEDLPTVPEEDQTEDQ